MIAPSSTSRGGDIDCGVIPARRRSATTPRCSERAGREQLREVSHRFRTTTTSPSSTPPGVRLIATNTWVAADAILVPCPPEVYALEGLAKLARHLTEIRHRLNPALEVRGILLTLAELHTIDGRATADALRAGAPWPVLDTVIAKRVAYRQAASERVGVATIDPKLTEVWDRVADEVFIASTEVANVA